MNEWPPADSVPHYDDDGPPVAHNAPARARSNNARDAPRASPPDRRAIALAAAAARAPRMLLRATSAAAAVFARSGRPGWRAAHKDAAGADQRRWRGSFW